jgi:hypothetical protein
MPCGLHHHRHKQHRGAWQGVQIYDYLDTSILTLIDDSIYIDGIRLKGRSLPSPPYKLRTAALIDY